MNSWCRRHRTQEAINKSLICQRLVQEHYIKNSKIEVCPLRRGDQARATWWDKSHNSVHRPVVLHHSWLEYIISLWKGVLTELENWEMKSMNDLTMWLHNVEKRWGSGVSGFISIKNSASGHHACYYRPLSLSCHFFTIISPSNNWRIISVKR